MFKELLKQISTGIDGESYDIGRILWLITTIGILLVTAYMLYKGLPVSIQDLGISLGANATAHGSAIMMKRGTEPTTDGTLDGR